MNAAINPNSHSWMKRTALAVVMVIGAFLIALPLTTGLPGKSEASGNMMTAFRPAMTDAALAQGAADQKTMGALAQELSTGVIPAVAAQMHMTPAELTTYIGTNFPAVGKGLAEFTAMSTYFGNLQATMVAQQANFQAADQIPTSFIGPTSMTMLFVIPGILLFVLGAFGLFRPVFGRRLLVAGGAVGGIMVIGLLSVSMYAKASSADTMTTAFQPIFASQSVQQGQAYAADVQAMGTQMTQQAFPGLATALHMTPVQFGALMTQNFPAVATGLAQFPAIAGRMQGATSLIAANVDNYNQSASIPWSPGSMVMMFWFMMVPAIVALFIGVGALFLTGHRKVVLPAVKPHGAMHS